MRHAESSRRGFLGGVMAAAGLGLPAGAPAAAAAEDIKLGVVSFCVSEFQRGLAIKLIQKCNVEYVCVKNFHLPYRDSPEELARGAKEFAKAGLKIVGGGVIDPELDKDIDLRRFFDYAKACTMPLLVLYPSQQTLARVEELVKEYGIAVAFHHRSAEKDPKFLTTMSVIKAVQGMDPRVGVCVDVLHPVQAPKGTNLDLLDTIRAAGSRLLDVHIKDYKYLPDGKKLVQVPVGDGAMPVVEIFKLLKKANYRGYVNLEYLLKEDDPLLGMAKSFAYMRGVVAGLRG